MVQEPPMSFHRVFIDSRLGVFYIWQYLKIAYTSWWVNGIMLVKAL